jgi:hypothetical protein
MTTTHNGKQRATSEFKRNRAKLLADDPPCHWCGIARATEADHLLESDAGGTNDITNLVPACKPCNARRGQAYRVRKERENNGVLEINTQSSNNFFIETQRKPYSADLICVDEVWSVSEAAIDEGLLPSQRARKNPLMSMWSTAGTPESKAMLRWREQGIRAIDAGDHGPLYFAEFSPPSNIDPMTPEAWKYANPALGHTLDMRVIEAEAKAPNRNAFLRGSVNTWTSSHSGWLENGLWEACLFTGEVPAGGVLAIEQSIDEARYVGVRAVRVENKTVITNAFDVDNMAEMWACVDREVARDPQLRIAITPVLETHCPPKHERRRVIVGYRELLKWTLAVRSLIVENRIGQTGEKLLAEHVERAVMIKHQGSVALSSTRSPGPIELARCMVWAAALESRPSSSGKPLLVISR